MASRPLAGAYHRARAVLLAVLLAAPAWAVLPLASPDAAAAGSTTPDNLLHNGDFERAWTYGGSADEPLYWYRSDDLPSSPDYSFALDPSTSHNGSRSARIELNGGIGHSVYWYQETGVPGRSVLPFGVWVKARLDAGSSVGVHVTVYNGTHAVLIERQALVSSGVASWREVRGAPVEAPPDATLLRFECVLTGPGEAWFDDAYAGRPTDMDNPPIVVSVPPLEAPVGHAYTYRARAVDLEGDAFTFRLEAGPDGMSVSPDGTVSWTPASVPEGAVRVLLNVTDDRGHSGFQDFFLQVLATPRPRPVNALLLSAGDDHVNTALSAERFSALMPAVKALRDLHPASRASVTMLWSGADAAALHQTTSGAPADVLAAVKTAVAQGWADVGWSSLDEPTYAGNPLAYLHYSDASWDQIVTASGELMSVARDPLNGTALPGDPLGGLSAVGEWVGYPSAVALAAEDPAQLHALDRWDANATLVALPGAGPAVRPDTTPRDDVAMLASMLAEDPNAPYGLYWEDGHLRIATADLGADGVPVLLARAGPDALEGALGPLDPSRAWVVPVLAMDTGLYCNGSVEVGGVAVGSPMQWAYANPGSPALPGSAVRSPSERAALYAATNRSLEWLATQSLPSRDGRFMTSSDLLAMVDDGGGRAAPASELASAARDLLDRSVGLNYPQWVSVQTGICRGDYRYFSLAEMYGLLARALGSFSASGALPASVEPMRLVGPMEDRSPAMPWGSVQIRQVVDEATSQALALEDQAWRVEPLGVVPSSSSPGGTEANAMEFLLLMAEAYVVLYEGGSPDALVQLFPTYQWPLTLQAMRDGGYVRFPAASWGVRPASATTALDKVPPSVARVSPAPGARAVPLDARVTVTFSERMDESLPLEGALALDPPAAGELRWSSHRLVLDPTGPLEGNTTYSARVAGSLADVAGNPLGAPFVWTFTTTGAPNQVPQLTPSPNVTSVLVLENGTLRLSVAVSDDGPPPLTFRWLLDGARMPGEGDDALLYSPTYRDSGHHRIGVVVQDAYDPPGVATFTWDVEVVDVNIPPRLVAVAPPPGDVVLNESANGSLAFRMTAVDPDEGFLRYDWTLDGAPLPAEALSDGGAAYTFAYGFDSAGNHTLGCRVEDRQGAHIDVGWRIHVIDVDRPPAIADMSPLWYTTIELGRTVRVRVNATDPDGDPLGFHWSVDGTERAVTATGSFNFTPERDGSYALNVSVVDGRGGRADATLTVNVLPVPDGTPGPIGGGWLPWALVAAALIAIAMAILWPELRRRRAS